MFEIRHRGKDILIPYRNEVVLNIDSKSKQINVNLPEGLLEVYFSSDSSDEDGNGGSF